MLTPGTLTLWLMSTKMESACPELMQRIHWRHLWIMSACLVHADSTLRIQILSFRYGEFFFFSFFFLVCRFTQKALLRPNGLYAQLSSLFSQECTNGEIVLRALHDLPKGTEITISYHPLGWDVSTRQERCTNDYGFTCRCERLADNLK